MCNNNVLMLKIKNLELRLVKEMTKRTKLLEELIKTKKRLLEEQQYTIKCLEEISFLKEKLSTYENKYNVDNQKILWKDAETFYKSEEFKKIERVDY